MALTKIQPGMLAPASVLLETFSATGTASSSTFLRGDNVWAVVPIVDLNTLTNQKLFTTSSVVFAAVSATTGTFNTIYVGTSTNVITWNPFVPLLLSISGTSVNVGSSPTQLTLRSTTGESSLSSGGGTLTLNNSGFNYSGSTATFTNLTVTNTATITNLAFGNTSTTQVGFARNILGNGVGNGALLYQQSPNTTGFLGQGSAGWLLVSGGSGQNPAFTSTGSIFVGNANKSTNIAGGSANQIPYQTAADTTNFIGTPTTTGTYLTWTGSDFAWNTISDQALFTTSSVTFAAVSATTGTFDTLNATTVTFTTLQATTGTFGGKIITGGFPTASVSTVTGSIILTNYTAIQRPGVNIRGFRSNYPTNETGFAPAILIEASRGTGASPTAVLLNDTLGALNFGGWDGATWSMDNQLAPFGIVPFALENWAGTATTSTNAGTGFFIRSQPNGVRLDSGSRQRLIQQLWTAPTSTNPPIASISFGAAQNTAPTLTRSDGSVTYTGYGATNLNYINTKNTIFGVTAQDAAPDNPTLLSSNGITMAGGRRSGVSGRRDALLANDELGFIDFRGQTAPNGTGTGLSGATIKAIAEENFTSTSYGTNLQFNTVDIGGTGITTRIATSNTLTTYNSNIHIFNDGAGINNSLILTASSATVSNLYLNNLRIHLGINAGNNNQFSNAVAIGQNAGFTFQGTDTVAVGVAAGSTNQGQLGIAIGGSAGSTNQGEQSVAIGFAAGANYQGTNAVAIGYNSGANDQGANSVAIGARAGVYQGANSIVINATGSNLNGTTGTFQVAPIAAGTGPEILFYNTATSEISRSSTLDFIVSTDPQD